MVCQRCITAVRNEFVKQGVEPIAVELGEVTLNAEISIKVLKGIENELNSLGFEIISNPNLRTVEKIKNCIIHLVHYPQEEPLLNHSVYIEQQLKKNYHYLSNLFSEIEGITIEKYIILQKIEKVKELLLCNELSLNEIAFQMGYSSAAYVSGLFKRNTGVSPSQYKLLNQKNRIPLDKV